MADNEQIGNIIIIEKEKIEVEGIYDIETHKAKVSSAMAERGYTKDLVEEWISYIE